MALLTIINNWRLIAVATIATAFAVLISVAKSRGKQINHLKHEIKIKDTKSKITKEQSKQKENVMDNEHKEIEELMSDVKESRHNDVNSL